MGYDDEDDIRRRAYAIWEREGCPEGRADAHWQMAREELAQAANAKLARKPNPLAAGSDTAPRDQPVESLDTVRRQGDFPGLRDQGDEQSYRSPPHREDRVPPPHSD